MSGYGGEFNRSRQHLLILSDWEASDGEECTDMVHAEAEGRTLGALEESLLKLICCRSANFASRARAERWFFSGVLVPRHSTNARGMALDRYTRDLGTWPIVAP